MSIPREIRPSPALAPFVECFWTREISRAERSRILPDGCADIIFFLRNGELIRADVVGVMTRPHLVPLEANLSLLGVRFRPGVAGTCLPCDLPSLNDGTLELRELLGADAGRITRGVFEERGLERQIAVLEERLLRTPAVSQVQAAIAELVGQHGQLSLEDFAELADVSPRQLRRTCLRHSGLAPKQLARIIRFRHAFRRIRAGRADLAELAIECGYCDQPHMNRDFRQLAGMSPTQCVQHHVWLKDDDRSVQDDHPAAG